MWQGGVWLGGHAWQGEGSGRESMVGGVAHMPPSPSRYYEIRSMSGRYASYWNVFLLHKCYCNINVKTKKEHSLDIFNDSVCKFL